MFLFAQSTADKSVTEPGYREENERREGRKERRKKRMKGGREGGERDER